MNKYASIFRHNGCAACRDSSSELRLVRTGNDLQELIDGLVPFHRGRVVIYDLTNLNLAATVFHTGRIVVRQEYRDEAYV